MRNNIQKTKIDMANEVIDAGRFNMATTQEERKETLEALLQARPLHSCPQTTDSGTSSPVWSPCVAVLFSAPALIQTHCRPALAKVRRALPLKNSACKFP